MHEIGRRVRCQKPQRRTHTHARCCREMHFAVYLWMVLPTRRALCYKMSKMCGTFSKFRFWMCASKWIAFRCCYIACRCVWICLSICWCAIVRRTSVTYVRQKILCKATRNNIKCKRGCVGCFCRNGIVGERPTQHDSTKWMRLAGVGCEWLNACGRKCFELYTFFWSVSSIWFALIDIHFTLPIRLCFTQTVCQLIVTEFGCGIAESRSNNWVFWFALFDSICQWCRFCTSFFNSHCVNQLK